MTLMTLYQDHDLKNSVEMIRKKPFTEFTELVQVLNIEKFLFLENG